jgi:hypothetical protein
MLSPSEGVTRSTSTTSFTLGCNGSCGSGSSRDPDVIEFNHLAIDPCGRTAPFELTISISVADLSRKRVFSWNSGKEALISAADLSN